jgi:hypothetical protein
MLAGINNNAESLSYRMSASSYQYQGLPMQCQHTSYGHRMFGCWSNRAVLQGVRECRPYQPTQSKIKEEIQLREPGPSGGGDEELWKTRRGRGDRRRVAESCQDSGQRWVGAEMEAEAKNTRLASARPNGRSHWSHGDVEVLASVPLAAALWTRTLTSHCSSFPCGPFLGALPGWAEF